MPSSHTAHRLRSAALAAIGGAVALLAIAACIFGYFQWQHQAGRAALAAEIERIHASGEPLTAEELAAWYRVPEGETDLTAEYLEGLKPFEGMRNLTDKDVELLYIEVPRPPKPWSQLEDAEAVVEKFQPLLRLLHRATDASGAVRYPASFSPESANTHLLALRMAANVLRLEHACSLHRGDSRRAMQCLLTLVRLADSLRGEPEETSQVFRSAMYTQAISELRKILVDQEVETAILAEFQMKLEAVDWSNAYLLATLGARGYSFEATHALPEHALGKSQVEHFGIDPNRPMAESDPLQCALVLQLQTALVNAARKPYPERVVAGLKAAEDIEHALLKQKETAEAKDKAVPKESRILLALLSDDPLVFSSLLRADVNHRCALAALALERYRRERGELPESLEALVPEYLDAVPVDPCDGLPLRYKRNRYGYLLYSLGTNLIDDGGDVGREGSQGADLGWFVGATADSAP